MIKDISQYKELKKGDVVKFVGLPDEEYLTSTIKNGDLYLVEKNNIVNYIYSFVIKPKSYYQVSLSNDISGSKVYPALNLNLYPQLDGILYQIQFGVKWCKSTNIYIQCPSGKYYPTIDNTMSIPDPTNPVRSGLGVIREITSDYKNPSIVFEVVRGFDEIVLNFVNTSETYDKIIMKFRINRCLINKIDEYKGEVYEITSKEYDRW